MVKFFIGLVMIGLGTYVAYHELSGEALDARGTLEAGVTQVKSSTPLSPEQEQLLRVQLALADYSAANGTPPPSLGALVPTYFDAIPVDPSTGKPFEYSLNGEQYQLGAQTKVVAAPGKGKSKVAAKAGKAEAPSDAVAFVNPNTIEMDFFTYDPEGKRDPFEPFNFAPKARVDQSLPPLQRYSVGQLRVTAILNDKARSGERFAIVEDATGRGYPVRKGTLIGNRNGVVVSIEEKTINVVESVVDFTGKETKVPVVMSIPVRSERDEDRFNKSRSRRR